MMTGRRPSTSSASVSRHVSFGLDVLRRLPYAGFLMVAIDSLLAEAIERARRGWHFEHGKSCELVVEFCRRGKGWKSD
jgi:hypothetical protein